MGRPQPALRARPFARLAAPLWVAATTAYLKDMEAMGEKLRGPKDTKKDDKEEPKGGGRGRRGGAGGGAAGEHV